MKFSGWIKQSLMDYPGNIATVLFTQGCNFRCPYCHNPELIPRGEGTIMEEDVMEYLDKNHLLLDGIVITGGEPTLHTELLNFIKRIKDLGLNVKLDTNGTNPVFLSKLLEQKVIDYVAMDIKTELTTQAYSKAIGISLSPKMLSRIRQSISLIIESGVEHEFRTTVCRELISFENIHNIFHEIKGTQQFFFQQYQPNIKQYANSFFSSYSKEEIEEMIIGNKEKIPVFIRE